MARPRAEIICDHNHIEDQKIDVINKRDLGMMEFRFKLRAPTNAITALSSEAKDKRKNGQTEVVMPSGTILKRGQIKYERFSSLKDPEILCDATVLEKIE